jgi:hypothetical protein
MVWSWIADAFERLPGCSDRLFQNLWNKRRLRFQGSDMPFDDIDEYSARLISAYLSTRPERPHPLLILLPDFDVHRPPVLFATAILRYWAHSLRRSQLSGRDTILYFGSTVGIREHLRRMSVQGLGLNLADVFRPQDVTARSGREKQTFRSSSENVSQDSKLPRVKTIYAPADPVFIVEQEKPSLVAIDLGDAGRLPWLESLIEYLANTGTQAIAWGQNPLSGCVEVFAQKGSVFSWPTPISLPRRAEIHPSKRLEACLTPSVTTRVQPLTLEGELVEKMDLAMRQSYKHLIQASSRRSGQLGDDATRLHWRYLRSLERLCIPVDLYEAEAPRFWGMRSFGYLRSACDRFRSACENSYADLAADLNCAAAPLENALELVRADGPPLWRALSNLCVEEPTPGKVRIITFTNQARKQLFLFALLAKFNITEEDLDELRIRIIDLEQARDFVGGRRDCDPMVQSNGEPTRERLSLQLQLVGLPSNLGVPRLLPLLLEPDLQVLMYPHQLPALQRLASAWRTQVGPDFERIEELLGRLSGLRPPSEKSPPNRRINIAGTICVNVGAATGIPTTRHKPPWQPVDASVEVGRLLDLDCGDEDLAMESVGVDDRSDGNRAPADSGEESWCDTAVQVEFEEGWRMLLAPDETINVVTQAGGTHKADERHVTSVRKGDRVVVIHGQRRQSLYDLIIARVHRNPAFELHVALIRRWQEDFGVAYDRWRRYGVRNLDELLSLLRQHGSTLTSPFTLRLWLWGRTLCPDDVEDLRRVAEVLDMGFVQQHYRRIGVAAARLRGLHRGLSNRLNHWLDRQAQGTSAADWDEQIDSELGLTFADFRNSLLILKVNDVRVVNGPFLRNGLGRLER